MTIRPIVNDALWSCLCPSYRVSAATYGLNPSVKRAFLRNGAATSHRSTFVPSQLRAHNTLSTEALSQPGSLSARGTTIPSRPSLARNAKQGKPSLVYLSTVQLYERLRSDAAAGRDEDVMDIVKILIKDRRERPNVRLYAGILHSFVNPEHGTAGKIRKILEEMAEVGVDLDAGACHCVLEVRKWHILELPLKLTMF
jgi:hypothetical protein